MEKVTTLMITLTPHLPVLGWISLIMLLLSVTLGPVFLARIPANYFIEDDLSIRSTKMPSIHYSLVWLLRNLAGLLLVIAGIAMMVLPGQGLLTIFLGLFVADFPGKGRLQRKLLNVPAVYKSINWIREKRGAEQLLRPPS